MKHIPALLALLLIPIASLHATSDKPNIIVIMADDLGYADLGCYGCYDFPTPFSSRRLMGKHSVGCRRSALGKSVPRHAGDAVPTRKPQSPIRINAAP